MFEEGEESVCPVCGMELARLEKLPKASHDVTEDGVPPDPLRDPLPITYMGRGKGLLLVLAVVGIALFFRPWANLTIPEIASLSGFFFARKLGWAWGALVGWMVLVPTVLTRRSILQMRGARVAAAALAFTPTITILVLRIFPPISTRLRPIRWEWTPEFWATLVVSLLATIVAVRLGGRVDDIRVARGTSAGHDVH